jgi:hypothetical protein
MQLLTGPSLGIGALVGIASSVLEPIGVPAVNLLDILFSPPVVSAIVAAGVAYGTMSTSLKHLEKDTGEMKKDLKDIGTRVARIEGKLAQND